MLERNSGERASQVRRIRILDTAEALFARHGFDGVTLRQVARAADVDLALPSYHFKNKRGLFDAVLLRRAEDINRWRQEALDHVLAAAGDSPPDLEAVIDAFLRPMLCHADAHEEGWRHYYELVAYVNNSPEWGEVLMTQYFNPLVKQFIKALERALPEGPSLEIYWSYHFLSGALALTFAQTGRLDILSDGLCRSADFNTACDRMVPFVAAGFRALVLGRA